MVSSRHSFRSFASGHPALPSSHSAQPQTSWATDVLVAPAAGTRKTVARGAHAAERALGRIQLSSRSSEGVPSDSKYSASSPASTTDNQHVVRYRYNDLVICVAGLLVKPLSLPSCSIAPKGLHCRTTTAIHT
uniref:Uncharacterized protein n=1 Tax=Mycena chlorophos TaxID=658473 RepID=A0ABQ0L7D9_MYCCL|nr:predicted protein [Mycena chlorophos]